MAVIATQSIAREGTALTMGAAANTDQCQTGNGVALVVENGSGASIDVTLTTPGTVGGLAIADRVVAVAAGATKVIPVGNEYRNPANNLCDIEYTSTTTITRTVIKI